MAVASGGSPRRAAASRRLALAQPAGAGAAPSSALMLVGYFAADAASTRGRRRSPGRQLPAKLDDFQGWLLDERTAENPNVIFAILDGFRAIADWLVTALTNMLLVADLGRHHRGGTLIVLRFGGWRAALIVLAAFVSFALMGLWEPSMQTLALMSAAVMLSLADRRSRSGSWPGARSASTAASRRCSTRCRSCPRSPT